MEKPNISKNKLKTKISNANLNEFDEKDVQLLAQRLDEEDYETPFDALNDWHLLRALAIHRPELTRPYLHLIDQEPFDED